MQEKVSIMCSWCGLVTAYAALRPRDGFSHPHKEHMKDTYNQAGTSTILIHMSSQTPMYAKFSLICQMTQQNIRLESCIRKKVK